MNWSRPAAGPALHTGSEIVGEGPVAVNSMVTRGVNVVGYFKGELGNGETARQVVAALEARGVPTTTVDVLARWSRHGHEYDVDARGEPRYPYNLICINADALPEFAIRAPERFFEDRYSIGMWWWEVGEFPERFRGAFDLVDEVWTGSRHVADALADVSPVPVVKVTMPVSVPEVKRIDRPTLGLPENFVFFFVFDYHSVFERKNPLATVEAFKRAFPEPGSGASLVIKSINGDKYPEEHERLRAATVDRSDVYLLDRYVSFDEKNAMFAGCDCYVSLHRSEGFGHTLAEAMYLGKPVIATAHSGNTDFMDARNSYPVNFELRSVGEGAAPYPPTAEWAEPDIEHAASLMRRVFEDREEAEKKGRRAAEDIRRDHSPEAAGRVMARRLVQIEERRDPAGSRPNRDPDPGSSGKPGPRAQPAGGPSLPRRLAGLARRAADKAVWPYTCQPAVNEQLLATIKGVRESLRETSYRLNAQDKDLVSELEQQNRDLTNRIEDLNASIDELNTRVEELSTCAQGPPPETRRN